MLVKELEHTIVLATVLDSELQLAHLSKVLEVIRHGPAILVFDRTKDGAENIPISRAVTLLEIVARSLMNILGSPEGTIGDIDVDGKTSAGGTNGGFGLPMCQLGIYNAKGEALTLQRRMDE